MNLEGRLIGDRYRILHFIGEGGMSRVYKAADTVPDCFAAIKFMKEGVTSHYLEDRIRFKREVEIAGKLRHPGIARIFGSGEYEGLPYIVMEFLEGQSFESYLNGRIPINKKYAPDYREITGIFLKLAEILEYVHRSGVVHRDVKPGNFFVSGEGDDLQFILLDFGVAQIMELAEIKEEAEISGTFGYMSPEATGRLTGGADERSDLYSLGVIFYRLLTGVLPFEEPDIGRLLHKQVAVEPPPPEIVNPSVPKILSGIVMKLIEKDPDSRYQSAGGLIHDINKVLVGETEFVPGSTDSKQRLTYRTRLIGREKEMSRLIELLNEAGRGKGGVCLIGGEAGSGKSRLVDEFRDYADKRDILLVGGRCLNHQSKSPYQPFCDALDEYLIRLEKQDGAAADGKKMQWLKERYEEWGEILVRLNPRMRKIFGETRELIPLEPDRETQRFLAVTSGFFCDMAAAADNGFILQLDDLQWADEGSIRLLDEIAARIGESGLMLVGSYRDNEASLGTRLAGRDAESAGQSDTPAKRVFEIKLGKWDIRAVNEMLSCIFGGDGDSMPELSGYLCNKSEGNPLFALSILRELAENGAVYRKDGKWRAEAEKLSRISIPGGIVDIILERIGRLTEPEKEILSHAAIIGREFDIELLCRVMGRPLDETVELTDKAVSLQFLETSTHKGRLLFAHDRIRDAFFSRMREKERQAVHRAILEGLEERKRDPFSDAVYQLAHHAIEAGMEEKILEYAVPAADRASAAYANEEAIRFYQIAQLLFEKRLPGSREHWAGVSEKLIGLYLLVGRNDDAIRMSEELLPVLEVPVGKAGIYRKIGIAYFKKGDWKNCEAYIARGLRLLGEKTPIRKAEVFVSLAGQVVIHLLHGLFPRKTPRKSISQDLEEKKEIAWSYYTLNWMYVLTDVFKVIYSAVRSLNLTESKIGPSKELGTSLSIYAGLCMTVSLFKRGLKFHQRALQVRNDLDDRWGQAQTFQFLGYNRNWRGEYAQSTQCFETSVAMFRQIGDLWEEGQSLLGMTGVSIYTNAYEKGISDIRRYFEQSKKVNNTYGMNAARQSWARLLIEMGKFDDAEEMLQASVISTRENDILVLHCLAHGYLGFLYLESDQYDRAVESLERSKGYYRENNFLRDPLLQIFPHLAEAYVKKLRENFRRTGIRPSGKELRKARLLCREALKETKRWISHFPPAIRAVAGFYALIGKTAKAEKLYKRGIEYSKKLGRQYEAAKGYFEYGLVLESLGKQREALENFQKAHELFDGIGAKAYVKKCEAVLPKEPSGERLSGGLTARDRLRYERRMNMVLATGKHISSILDLDELLKRIMEDVVELVGAERGVLLLYPEGGEKLQARVFHNVSREKEMEDGQSVSVSIISKVETEKTPLLIADALSEELFKTRSSVVLNAVKSVICVPIAVKGEMMGVIYLENNLVNNLFSEDDLEIISIIAGQAGVSIQNARMYSHLKEYLNQIEKSKDEIAEWNRTLEMRVEERTEELNERNHELAAAVAQLKEHADMVEELAVARERNRFAMDAHDHLGHTLTLLIKLLEVSRLTCLERPEKMAANLADASEIAREGLEQLRNSIKGLTTASGKEYNLLSALKGLAENFEALGIHVELTIQGIGSLKEPERINTLYNLCMEAMTNAVRHGKAKNISVIIKKEDGFLRAVLFDDGCGCEAIGQGFGLTGMEKRIRAVNGSITFSSGPGEGFLIHAEIPLPEEYAI
jgi:serine/threonine protein kinase/signal transduction histidine kinase